MATDGFTSTTRTVKAWSVCQVKQPILSVSRLAHQGFEVNFNSDTLEVKHKESCNSALRNRNGLFYTRLRKATMPQGMQLRLETVEDKQVAMIAPTTMTPHGPQVMRGGYTDIWAMNNEGYLVRIHKRLRKALFTPFNTDCPIPADQLENYRKTVVRQPGQPQRIVTDSFQTLTKQQQNRLVEGQAWIGETWFKPKATARPVTTAMPNTTAKAIEAEHKAKTTTATPQDKQAEAQQPKQTQAPATRHTGKQTQKEPTIPSTTEVDKTNDYWIKGGRLWKRETQDSVLSPNTVRWRTKLRQPPTNKNDNGKPNKRKQRQES